MFDKQTFGDWTVTTDQHESFIYPVNPRTGKSIRVRLVKAFLTFTHANGRSLSFSRYKHQRRWLYRDSRHKNGCTRDHVVREVARLAFDNDQAKAGDLIAFTLDLAI
jgi:hypothetical protein